MNYHRMLIIKMYRGFEWREKKPYWRREKFITRKKKKTYQEQRRKWKKKVSLLWNVTSKQRTPLHVYMKMIKEKWNEGNQCVEKFDHYTIKPFKRCIFQFTHLKSRMKVLNCKSSPSLNQNFCCRSQLYI